MVDRLALRGLVSSAITVLEAVEDDVSVVSHRLSLLSAIESLRLLRVDLDLSRLESSDYSLGVERLAEVRLRLEALDADVHARIGEVERVLHRLGVVKDLLILLL